MEVKKSYASIIIITILVLLVAVLGGYIIYERFIKEDEVIVNNCDNDVEDNKDDNDEISDIKNSSSIEIASSMTKEYIERQELKLVSEYGNKGNEIEKYMIKNIEIIYQHDNEIAFTTKYDVKIKDYSANETTPDFWGMPNGTFDSKTGWWYDIYREIKVKKIDDDFVIVDSGTGGMLVDYMENNWRK